MKVKCLRDDGLAKRNREYLVTGIFLGGGSLDYLIDEGEVTETCSCLSFEVIDNRIPPNWFCKTYSESDSKYSYKEAIWGYYELCFDEQHYNQVAEMEPEAMLLYHQRKLETEKSLNEWETFSLANDKQKQQSFKNYSVVIAEDQIVDFQRRSRVAEIWDKDRIIATVAENYTDKTFDVEMYPPTRGPLLLDYTAFEKAMQLARAKLMGHIF